MGAMEMDVMMCLLKSCAISPGTVFSGDFVREAIGNQPFEHAVDGYAINLLIGRQDRRFDLGMAQGVACMQQQIQHRNSRLSCAPARLDEFFGFG